MRRVRCTDIIFDDQTVTCYDTLYCNYLDLTNGLDTEMNDIQTAIFMHCDMFADISVNDIEM